MKRLLQINPVLRTSTSTGRIIQEIGEQAEASGWESYVAYSAGRDRGQECSSRTVPIGDFMSVIVHGLVTRLTDRHGLASSHATRKFIRRVKELDPDIIHIHNIHGYFLNYKILFDYLRNSGKHIVWTVHDCWLFTGHCYHYDKAGCRRWKTGCGHCPLTHEFPKSWLIDRSAANWKDKHDAFCSIPKDKMTIVTVSEWMRNEMQASFLGKYRNIVIHNGIDTKRFRPMGDSSIRREYGIGNRRMYLGAASIWSDAKGLGDFKRMAERLDKDEVIVLAGISPEQTAGLPDTVIPVYRTADMNLLAKLYSTADVFLNLTYQDNYPTVNLEAISCGTPVITYRTGGSPESITDGTGAVVSCGDIHAALDKARSIAVSDRGTWRTRCRQHALASFRKEDRYNDYTNLYKRLLDE